MFKIRVDSVVFTVLLASLLSVTPAAAQVITTFVGNGTAGFSGDNGPALQAEINNPHGLAEDFFGNLYIADSKNARVRRVDGLTGKIHTVAGNGTAGFSGDGGPATSAQLGFPDALALDLLGNLYICDADGHIRKVNAQTGVITTVAGGGTQTGENIPATQAQLNNPFGVAVDFTGAIFISDSNNVRVRRVDPLTGHIQTIAGIGPPGDFAGSSGDGGPAIKAALALPTGLALDAAGNLYIAELFGSSVRRIDRITGIITTYAGNHSGTPAVFGSLIALTFDPLGNLYIADGNNNRVHRVDASTGVVTTVAGSGPEGTGIGAYGGDGGPATEALLNSPSGLAFDLTRGLLIADQNNNRVRLVPTIDGIFPGAPVSDDFNSPVLNKGLWEFVNPVGDGSYSLNGSELLLNVPGGSNHDPAFNGMDNSVRVVQYLPNIDFQAEVKFDSIPNLQYQFMGILVEQDPANYLRLQLGSNGSSLVVSANTILAHNQTDDFSSDFSVPPSTTSLWLRVRRSGTIWTVSWSVDGVTFNNAGSILQALTTADIGVFAGNYNSGSAPAFTAKADYFLITPVTTVIQEEEFGVSATSNIYGAGHASPPGDGALPPSVSFAAGAGQVLQFASVTGTWFETNFAPLGVDGSTSACAPFTSIHVNASGGISSYDTTDFCNALVGVFLGPSEPTGAGPAGLRFYETDNSKGGTKTNFTSLSPSIGQVFFIGDGLTGTGTGSIQVFNVPPSATRLFLGQADACNFNGSPDCYFDNGGSIQATFTISKH
jgi:sugar lactone lactonase YvrE